MTHFAMTVFTASSQHYYSNVRNFLFIIEFLFGEHTENKFLYTRLFTFRRLTCTQILFFMCRSLTGIETKTAKECFRMKRRNQINIGFL